MDNKPRIWVLLSVFILLFVIIVIRLVDLQIINQSFYEKKSLEQRTRLIKLAAQRGDIVDRNGEFLATSIDTYSLYKNKQGWLARKLPLLAAIKIRDKDPQQINLLKEKKRVYPNKNLAAQLLGFVGLDNQGLAGLELAFDEYLRGKEGKVITEGDPEGKELYGALREVEPGSDGMNLTLTIDENIQYVAEREISKQIKQSKAISGMCLVMDAKTGEILALASIPGFDPNQYKNSSPNLWHPRYLDPFEPGSTFKLITVAAALEEGVITDKTKLEARDTIVVGGKVIGNSHEMDWQGSRISISEMLEDSINTGAVQVGLKLGKEKFYNCIRGFGFGRRTDFGLWGESRGILRHWKKWYKPDIGMMTFGQSIAVTPLQLVSAISAFTNNGKLLKPFIVKKIESIDGQFVKLFTKEERGRAVSGQVAEQLKKYMDNIVVKGSGKPAKIRGFVVGGKTGTAQKTGPGGRGYLKDRYIASFVGFAPYDNPRVICLVIVDDPKGVFWGSTVAGPVFKNVVEYSLRYLNVKPDML